MSRVVNFIAYKGKYSDDGNHLETHAGKFHVAICTFIAAIIVFLLIFAHLQIYRSYFINVAKLAKLLCCE
jgi:hypothetical protein